jgi:hypothetical protein
LPGEDTFEFVAIGLISPTEDSLELVATGLFKTTEVGLFEFTEATTALFDVFEFVSEKTAPVELVEVDKVVSIAGVCS